MTQKKLKNKTKPNRSKRLNRNDLKIEVYNLAGVKTTKKLKLLKREFNNLDFRRTRSWEEALIKLSSNRSDIGFEDWTSNPPDEYKELFSEIEQVSHSYNQNIKKGLRVSKSLQHSAKDLQSLSEDLSDEAKKLNDDATSVELRTRI